MLFNTKIDMFIHIVSIAAPRVTNIQSAIEFIYPLVVDFNAGPRLEKSETRISEAQLMNKRRRLENRVHIAENNVKAQESDFDSEEEEFDSDESQD